MSRKLGTKGRRLTNKIVADLPYRSKQYSIWDRSLEGCGVRISARTKACVICVRTGVSRKFKTIGAVTSATPYEFLRERALQEIAKLKGARLSTRLLANESTLAQVRDDYIAAHPDLRSTTIQAFQDRLRRDFSDHLDLPLVLLSTDEILKRNEERTQKLEDLDPIHRPPKGFYGWQSTLRYMRTLVSWYAARKRRPNPWPDRRVLPLKPPQARELPVELQCSSGRRRLIEGLKSQDSATARGCLFLCYTGLRKKEGMSITATNLLTDAVVELQSKTRTLRVPLARQATLLMDRTSDTTLLKVGGTQLRRPLVRIFGERDTSRGKRARVTPHDLRRLFKSVGAELGIDPIVLNLLVGHAIKGVDKHYLARLRLGVLQKAAQRIADEIDNPQEIEGEADLLMFTPKQKPPAAVEPASIDVQASEPSDNVLRYLQSVTGAPQAIRLPTQSHYLSREELHELVWTAPIDELKHRFGLSGRGIAKICTRFHIPVPGRGHWARTSSGRSVASTPLPARPRGMPRLVRIRGKVRFGSAHGTLAAVTQRELPQGSSATSLQDLSDQSVLEAG